MNHPRQAPGARRKTADIIAEANWQLEQEAFDQVTFVASSDLDLNSKRVFPAPGDRCEGEEKDRGNDLI